MLSTGIVIFREALEIALILGIVLAATRGLAGRMLWILGGFIGGAAGAGLVAIFAEAISSAASGVGQELFNAGILLVAAIFIGWTVLWMRKNSRHMAAEFRKVGHDVAEGSLPRYTLSLIIGLAILREGSEIVLFIYGMVLSGQTTASIIGGSVIGLMLGLFVGILLYYGLLRLSTKYMLKITSWLLILLVCGLTAQAASYLLAAGYFADFSKVMWDSSWLLNDHSIFGKSLHSLIGYSARPTEIQIIFYLGTLFLLVMLTSLIERKHKHAHPKT